MNVQSPSPPYKYVQTRPRRDGSGVYYYFIRRGGEIVRLEGEPGTAEFDRSYHGALHGAREAIPYKRYKEIYGDFHAVDRTCYFEYIEKKARGRAKRAGRAYDLPGGWAKAQFERQEKRCALSGVLFNKDRDKHAPLAPSIDRKNSDEGYTPENCQLVTYIVNCAKNQFTGEEFLDMCRAVVRKSGGLKPRRKKVVE